MHVMFIHPNFPGQFGHIANYLSQRPGWQCTCVCSIDTTHLRLPFTHINYKVQPGPQPKVFYNPDNVQGLMDHMLALYTALRSAPQVKPDLVVGHMSYGTMLYLRNLYNCPFVGYYELLPSAFWGDGLVLRKEYPPPEGVRLFNAIYHTFTHLHLNAVDACYTPTHYQLKTAPAEYQHKIRVIFDGVDTDLFQPRVIPRPTEFYGVKIGKDDRVVTYVSRGLESARGFDIFMKAAKKIAAAMPNVHFFIAGNERCNYGHENHHIGQQSFKDYVLKQDKYDLTNFHFLGVIPLQDLATLYNLSDLHIYLTVPYVLSWSMVQAMAAGCTILGSATAPIEEVIDHGIHGLLVDFYDDEALAKQALEVLRDPPAYRHLGDNARARVVEQYSSAVCIPRQEAFFREMIEKRG